MAMHGFRVLAKGRKGRHTVRECVGLFALTFLVYTPNRGRCDKFRNYQFINCYKVNANLAGFSPWRMRQVVGVSSVWRVA